MDAREASEGKNVTFRPSSWAYLVASAAALTAFSMPQRMPPWSICSLPGTSTMTPSTPQFLATSMSPHTPRTKQ